MEEKHALLELNLQEAINGHNRGETVDATATQVLIASLREEVENLKKSNSILLTNERILNKSISSLQKKNEYLCETMQMLEKASRDSTGEEIVFNTQVNCSSDQVAACIALQAKEVLESRDLYIKDLETELSRLSASYEAEKKILNDEVSNLKQKIESTEKITALLSNETLLKSKEIQQLELVVERERSSKDELYWQNNGKTTGNIDQPITENIGEIKVSH